MESKIINSDNIRSFILESLINNSKNIGMFETLAQSSPEHSAKLDE